MEQPPPMRSVQPVRLPSAPPDWEKFEQFGGEPFFTALVAAFYRRVAMDPVLRPMYPEPDLGPAERRLRLFLMQYWGGPKTYGEERGHPRLRMRHAPYPVDLTARDHWLGHMRAALDEQQLPADLDAELWQYLDYAAAAMVNVPPPGWAPTDR